MKTNPLTLSGPTLAANDRVLTLYQCFDNFRVARVTNNNVQIFVANFKGLRPTHQHLDVMPVRKCLLYDRLSGCARCPKNTNYQIDINYFKVK